MIHNPQRRPARRNPGFDLRPAVLMGALVLAAGIASSTALRAATLVVTNTEDSGPGSLRQAIIDANQTFDPDRIEFNIPGAGVQTIFVRSNLPGLNTPITIDGYTQPGATPNSLSNGNNAVLRIEINGSLDQATNGPRAFTLSSTNIVLRGLIVSDFDPNSIRMLGGGNNVLEGNFIGCDPTGLVPRRGGTAILVQSPNNRIGGPTPAQRNLVFGAGAGAGIFIGNPATHTVVIGNFIGLNAAGESPANSERGIEIADSSFNRIGGPTPGEGNTVGGFATGVGAAIRIRGSDSTGNLIQGNNLGVAPDGVTPRPNGAGVLVINRAHHNLIGGLALGEGNRIWNNLVEGLILRGLGQGNAALGNSIFNNAGIGIDLDDDGPTPNDALDADSGSNQRQNYPQISVAVGGPQALVSGHLSSSASATFRLEFFSSPAPNPSEHCEGATYLGAVSAQTDPSGEARFSFAPAAPIPPGSCLTATATDGDGNTSEFSEAIPAATPIELRFSGSTALGGTVTATNPVILELSTGYPSGHLYYTLDGSDPRHGSIFSGPLLLDQSCQVRALVFSADFSRWTEATPVVFEAQIPPSITIQPQFTETRLGDPAAFDVGASGAAPLAYQWLRNEVARPDATNRSLLLPAAALADAGAFRVVVTNRFGRATSEVALLRVIAPIEIIGQPTNIVVPPGIPSTNVTFCVNATGTDPLTYQWRFNGAYLRGETNRCLYLPNAQLTNNGHYSVLVVNEAGAAESAPATLEFIVDARQPGDAFTNRVALDATTSGTVSGSNQLATAETAGGEPPHAGKAGGRSVWYSWPAPASGVVTLETRGSSFDTLVAVYTGDRLGALTPVASDDDSGGFGTSLLRFNAEAGTIYQIAIDGYGGDAGRFVLHWVTEASAGLIPAIERQPISRTTTPGGTATFDVDASAGNAPLAYQWLYLGTVLVGATNRSLVVSNASRADVGTYQVLITNVHHPDRFALSLPAWLELGPDPGRISVDKDGDLPALSGLGGGGEGGGTAPSAGTTLGSVFSQLLYNTNSSSMTGEVSICGRVPGRGSTRWYSFPVLTNGILIVDTAGSSVPTVRPRIYQVKRGVLATAVTNFPLNCECPCASNACDQPCIVSISTVTDRPIEIKVAVDSQSGAEGLIQINWKLGAPPVFKESPPDALLESGQPVALSAVALNPVAATVNSNLFPAPALQWWRNGRLLIGETNSRLTFAALEQTQAGLYHLTATNAFGVSASRPFRLAVLKSSAQAEWKFDAGSGRTDATVGIDLDAGLDCRPTYRWWQEQTPLEPNLFPGAASPILTIPALSLASAGVYRLEIDACGFHPAPITQRVQVDQQIAFRPSPEARDVALRFVGVSHPVGSLVLEASPDLVEWQQVLTTRDFTSPLALPNAPPAIPPAPRFYRARLLPP